MGYFVQHGNDNTLGGLSFSITRLEKQKKEAINKQLS
jgi:hypothetical protein